MPSLHRGRSKKPGLTGKTGMERKAVPAHSSWWHGRRPSLTPRERRLIVTLPAQAG